MNLYSYQQASLETLIRIFRTDDAGILCSDTGTGKTVVAAFLAKELNIKDTLIIAPKATHPAWRKTCKDIGYEPLDIINIEKARRGKYCTISKGKKFAARWDENIKFIIFDEAHIYKSPTSQNSVLMAMCRQQKIKMLAMSATLIQTPLSLRALGYCLRFHNYSDFYSWLHRMGLYQDQWHNWVVPLRKAQEISLQLNKRLFPTHGVRDSIRDLPTFPENAIFSELIEPPEDKTGELEEAYITYMNLAAQAKNALVEALRYRQLSERIKCDYIAEKTENLIEEGKSVAIFVNFIDTHKNLTTILEKKGITVSKIFQDQTDKEREEEIAEFTADKTRCIVSMIQSGGVGVSLNDIHGNYPRVSLINPNFSAIQLKQALGRIHRANSKSKSLQYLLFLAGTIEEKISRKVSAKIKAIDTINDGDLEL